MIGMGFSAVVMIFWRRVIEFNEDLGFGLEEVRIEFLWEWSGGGGEAVILLLAVYFVLLPVIA